MKLIGQTHRAQVRRVDSLRRYAGLGQLPAIGVREGDVRPSLLSEMGGHFGADFIAALADARSDGGAQVARIGGESCAHSVYRGGGYVRGGASPSGMHGGKGAMALVDQQDGDAIGGFDSDDSTGAVFEEGVGQPQNAKSALGCDAVGRVDLLDGGEISEPGGTLLRRVPKPWMSQGSESSSLDR